MTLGKVYRVVRGNFNVSRDIPQSYLNFFVQDTWRVGNRLTVNPGLRYEQEKMSGTIIKDWSLKNNWGPRIGAAYDLTGDGKTSCTATTAFSTPESRSILQRALSQLTTASRVATTTTRT